MPGMFGARFSAEDFFDDIAVLQTARGREYQKGALTISEFPSELKATILSWPMKCGKPELENPESARNALESIVLRAEWKTRRKARSVGKLAVTIRQMSAEEWKQRPDAKKLDDLGLQASDPTAKGIWILEAKIQDAHVPTTDSLTITLASTDGKRNARFSARL